MDVDPPEAGRRKLVAVDELEHQRVILVRSERLLVPGP